MKNYFKFWNELVCRSVNILNNSDTKTIISEGLETTNGLGIDWIANNIYWTDNDNKVN